MLKKLAIASALALGFLGSFQFGKADHTSAADARGALEVKLVPEAEACICDPKDDMPCMPGC
jgi:hypothetical protein